MAVDAENQPDRWQINESLNELAQLAGTAGAVVVGQVSQKLPSPTKNYYIGLGKLEELVAFKQPGGYDVAIFDDELSALQQRNLEQKLGVKIIDRSALILDIFARHARTKEGILQVELAQSEYLLPRLAGQWRHLERLGGGIGTRGPGETQIETDRRLVQRKITHLKKQIENIRKHRRLYQKRRQHSGIALLALVGYTNTGKSSLLNCLSQAEIPTADKLFATLDPTTRRISLPDGTPFLLSDTVGFIHKLPPGLVSAFRATLEELSGANILLHVVDIASPRAAEQCQTVENILDDLEIGHKPRITVLNKIDKLLDESKEWNENEALAFLAETAKSQDPAAVIISARRKWGIDNLKHAIANLLPGS